MRLDTALRLLQVQRDESQRGAGRLQRCRPRARAEENLESDSGQAMDCHPTPKGIFPWKEHDETDANNTMGLMRNVLTVSIKAEFMKELQATSALRHATMPPTSGMQAKREIAGDLNAHLDRLLPGG